MMPQRVKETVYREDAGASLLDAVLEVGVRARGGAVAPRPGILEQVQAPAQKYSRGRRLVVRDVAIVAQDSDVLCQGGLFGSVEPSETVQGHMAAIQSGLFAEAATGAAARSVCVVCGDPRCGIGPFGGAK